MEREYGRSQHQIPKVGLLGKLGVAGIVAILALIVLSLFASPFAKNDAGYYTVVQTVFGKMDVRTEPGWFVKGFFSKTTPYRVADTLYFSKWEDEGSRDDNSIDVRFTDGGIGYISMNVRYRLPASPDQILSIHETFQSDSAFKLGSVEQMAMQAAQLTASMMTAEDSYRNKRPQFIAIITDQVNNGLYLTRTVERELEDGSKVQVQEPLADESGVIGRQPRDLDVFGVQITQVNVTDIDYDPKTQEQIDRKREASMAAELAEIETERAKQQKLQAEAEGQRLVTIAQYEKEQEKVQAVTEAQKNKEVAEIEAQQRVRVAELNKEQAQIDVQTAELEKEAAILRAEGEAESKRLILEADGALQAKLEALVQMNRDNAQALGQHRLVPDIMIGKDESGSQASEVIDLLNMLTINAAKQLQLDMSIKGQDGSQN